MQFSVISRTLVEEGLTPLQRGSRRIQQHNNFGKILNLFKPQLWFYSIPIVIPQNGMELALYNLRRFT